MYDDEDEDATPDIPQEVIDLTERLKTAEPELTKIGLYVDTAQPIPVQVNMSTVVPGLVLTCNVGDMAFTKKVQDPDAWNLEQAMTGTEAELERDAWLDRRQQIRETGSFFTDPG